MLLLCYYLGQCFRKGKFPTHGRGGYVFFAMDVDTLAQLSSGRQKQNVATFCSWGGGAPPGKKVKKYAELS